MEKETYMHLCQEMEAGRDAFVLHPRSREEGRVVDCILNTDHMIVSTSDGSKRCWDFHECERMSRRKKQ